MSAIQTGILPPAVLFDNVKPDEPHPALMHEFIRIFSRECTTELPFVNCESITAGYLSSTLSAPLANAMAAIAVPMAIAVPCLAGTDLRATSETYLATAKKLSASGLPSSFDNLEALILICYQDVKAGRKQESRPYMEKAVTMTIDLGKRMPLHSQGQEKHWMALRTAVAHLGQAHRTS